jgi:nucleoside-diphosphate-sugar epimerase
MAAARDENVLSCYGRANCIITGGLGFIGSHLARRLVALGANVILVDPSPIWKSTAAPSSAFSRPAATTTRTSLLSTPARASFMADHSICL